MPEEASTTVRRVGLALAVGTSSWTLAFGPPEMELVRLSEAPAQRSSCFTSHTSLPVELQSLPVWLEDAQVPGPRTPAPYVGSVVAPGSVTGSELDDTILRPIHGLSMQGAAMAQTEKRLLLPVVREAVERLGTIFGPAVQCRLDILEDQEVPGHTDVVLSVLTGLPVPEALALLDRFYESWWFDLPATVRTQIDVTVAFA